LVPRLAPVASSSTASIVFSFMVTSRVFFIVLYKTRAFFDALVAYRLEYARIACRKAFVETTP
jgi:hypothetical protein